jgi:hypothetical protein
VNRIVDAMWAGDTDLLWELAPCRCCCEEHTFEDCPARVWNGCRSGLGPAHETNELRSWARHYRTAHGLTQRQFFGS